MTQILPEEEREAVKSLFIECVYVYAHERL